MKFIAFLLLLPFVLFADTGAFLEIGMEHKNRYVTFTKEIDAHGQYYGTGFIYEFFDVIGTGMSVGWSTVPSRSQLINISLYNVNETVVHMFSNPVVLTLGYFRLLSYLGKVRLYTKYVSEKQENTTAYNLLPIRGIGVELPFLFRLKLGVTYLEQFGKEVFHRVEDSHFKVDPYRRIGFCLRYTFPSKV